MTVLEDDIVKYRNVLWFDLERRESQKEGRCGLRVPMWVWEPILCLPQANSLEEQPYNPIGGAHEQNLE
jgi:hypothetical protein